MNRPSPSRSQKRPETNTKRAKTPRALPRARPCDASSDAGAAQHPPASPLRIIRPVHAPVHQSISNSIDRIALPRCTPQVSEPLRSERVAPLLVSRARALRLSPPYISTARLKQSRAEEAFSLSHQPVWSAERSARHTYVHGGGGGSGDKGHAGAGNPGAVRAGAVPRAGARAGPVREPDGGVRGRRRGGAPVGLVAVPRCQSHGFYRSAAGGSTDDDIRELIRLASRAGGPPRPPGVGPRSQSVAIGRIDEDEPCEFGLDAEARALAMAPKSKSCTVGPTARTAHRVGPVA